MHSRSTIAALIALIGGAALLMYNFTQQAQPEPAGNVVLEMPAGQLPDTATLSEPPTPAGSDKLAVTIRYTAAPRFDLAIESIKHTNDQSTIEFYRPQVEGQHAVISLLADDGSVLLEKEFSVDTAVMLETYSDTAGGSGEMEQLNTSTAYLVLPLLTGTVPARVRLQSSAGETFDEQSVPAAAVSQTLWQRLLIAVQQPLMLLGEAQAQTGGTFTIAVINDMNAEDSLNWIDYQTKGVLTTEPWPTFRGRVKIEKIKNEATDFKCIVVRGYPHCPEDERVIQAVSRQVPNWNAIIVVYNINCNCGSVKFNERDEKFSPIAAIGTAGTSGIVMHLLGHTVGQMKDEFGYKVGGFPGKPEPNCYQDKKQCERALAKYRGEGKCSPGCVRDDLWRPSNDIMSLEPQPLVFGPIERCVMGRAIARQFNTLYSCKTKPGSFPGWIR